MEVRVNIGGIDATITVASAQEAAELLRSIALGAESRPAAAPRVSEPIAAIESPDSNHHDIGGVDGRSEQKRLQDAFKMLKGSMAARILITLAEADGATSIAVLKAKLGLLPDANLGPMFSNISKAVKGQGLDNSNVLKRDKARPAKKGGHPNYWFSLTPVAREVVKSYKDFGKAIKGPEDVTDEDI